MNADECHIVHESYELKWAGERDADEYRKKVAKEQRVIFALRNSEGKCLCEIQAEINVDECQRAHESYERSVLVSVMLVNTGNIREREKKGRRKRKRQGGGNSKSNSF